jgi:uncharacterized membrane protein required for colicin V production
LTILQLFPDLICIAVVLIFLILGANRGMFRTLSGLLTWLISLFGAKVLAQQGAVVVSLWLGPKLEPYVSDKLTQALAESGGVTANMDLGILGLIPGVKELLEGVTARVLDSLVPAIAQQLAQALAWLVFFILGFLLLKVVCRLAVKLLNLLDAVPGLHFVNHFVGAILGAVKGCLLVALVAWVLMAFHLLPDSLVQDTTILRALAEFGSFT